MCGLAGISLGKNDIASLDTAKVAVSLLLGIASRGPDATGAAWYEPSEEAVKITKLPVNTARFIAAREDYLPTSAPVILLHTRFATHGSKDERVNNHPILHRNIVGVHNGVLYNDDQIFKDLKRERNGKVDSEAIMALLSDGADPVQVLSKIGGDASVGWIDLDDPGVLHLARVCDRPLCIGQTKGGSLLFASTANAIRDAAKANGLELELEYEMEEASYMKIRDGVIHSYLKIPNVKPKSYSWSRQWGYTSGTTTTPTKSQGTVSKLPAKKKQSTGDKETEASRSKYREYIKALTLAKVLQLSENGSQVAKEELARRGLDSKGQKLKALEPAKTAKVDA
jgi:asparagine synthetase B (glutamine-hydrolysing)